ncbi:LpqB family beta-propeller domain-containing protein [Phytohabitans aurantiacus]|uniref:LpqB family beta-propeller domain-containing protein n=1 Tax=Phytohabitans aurantiacus TaxID=3016789 RepID=UPI0024920156|nr:LpqB family beta-propeller domain-containing protein [Phytohabitans aurantiacus]
MRLRAVLAVVVAAGVGMAGCGIPDETPVRVDGPGPSPGFATEGASADPPPREAAASKDQFVDNYLQAAAGEARDAHARVSLYLAPAVRSGFKATQEEPSLNLVRVRTRTVADNGDGTATATLQVDQVGMLDGDGQVNPPTQTATTYTIKVGEVEGKPGWFVTTPPDVLLLDVAALSIYYERQNIYFWNVERTGLVPDPRYMPRAVSPAGQPTEILDRLIAGPSELLGAAVRRLPAGTQRTGTVPDTGDRLEISLSAEAGAQDYDPVELGRQLMWSLPSSMRKDLELRIEGQSPRVITEDQAFLDANPAYTSAETPERFAIYGGRIYRLNSSPNGGRDPLPAIITNAVNHDILLAALASGSGVTAAALVVKQGAGQRLLVGTTGGDRPRGFTPVDTVREAIGRPVWLKAPLDTGLVVVGGKLYRFGLDGGALTQVSLPGVGGAVSAVSAAPDGRRIAVVAGGRLYVAAIGRDDQSVEVQAARAVPTSLQQFTEVAWHDDGQLTAAWLRGGRSAIGTVTIDGVAEEVLYERGEAQVTYLVDYPRSPTDNQSVMYVAGGKGYDSQGPDQDGVIEANEVVNGPSNAAPGSATAPFYLN